MDQLYAAAFVVDRVCALAKACFSAAAQLRITCGLHTVCMLVVCIDTASTIDHLHHTQQLTHTCQPICIHSETFGRVIHHFSVNGGPAGPGTGLVALSAQTTQHPSPTTTESRLCPRFARKHLAAHQRLLASG